MLVEDLGAAAIRQVQTQGSDTVEAPARLAQPGGDPLRDVHVVGLEVELKAMSGARAVTSVAPAVGCGEPARGPASARVRRAARAAPSRSRARSRRSGSVARSP